MEKIGDQVRLWLFLVIFPATLLSVDAIVTPLRHKDIVVYEKENPTVRLISGCTAMAVLCLFVSPSPASIVTLADGTANWNQVTGPVNFSTGATEGDNTTYIFQEQMDLTLASDLEVDIAGDGGFAGLGDPGSETVSAGTRVDSYIVHFDPTGATQSDFVRQEGMSVTFDTQILGIIGKTAGLDATDNVLGDSGSTYTPVVFRGTWDNAAGLNYDDFITVSGNTATFSWESRADFAEQFRIVTLAPAAVPEPSSMILLSMVGLGGMFHQRRKLFAKRKSTPPV